MRDAVAILLILLPACGQIRLEQPTLLASFVVNESPEISFNDVSVHVPYDLRILPSDDPSIFLHHVADRRARIDVVVIAEGGDVAAAAVPIYTLARDEPLAIDTSPGRVAHLHYDVRPGDVVLVSIVSEREVTVRARKRPFGTGTDPPAP